MKENMLNTQKLLKFLQSFKISFFIIGTICLIVFNFYPNIELLRFIYGNCFGIAVFISFLKYDIYKLQEPQESDKVAKEPITYDNKDEFNKKY